MVRQAQSREKLLQKKLEEGLTEKPQRDAEWDFSFPDPGADAASSYAVVATRRHLPMPGVVSFCILSRFGPRRSVRGRADGVNATRCHRRRDRTHAGELPTPVLMIQDVSFAYPNSEPLYHNLDLGIDLQSRIALVGPNGAGKTTFVKLMTGELQPTSVTQRGFLQFLNLKLRRRRRRGAAPPRCPRHDHPRVYASRECTQTVSRRCRSTQVGSRAAALPFEDGQVHAALRRCPGFR